MPRTPSKPIGKSTSPAAPAQPPQPLIDFMMTGWEKGTKMAVEPVEALDEHKARRKALSAKFPGEILVIPTGHEKTRANDTNYHFRPGSDFFYLVGNHEPDCLLVLMPKANGRGHESLLFVEPEVDRSTPAFFTDRARGALWVGARLGLGGSLKRYGVDKTLPLSEVGAFLKELAGGSRPVRVLRGLSPSVDALLPKGPRQPSRNDPDLELAQAISRLRLFKSEYEVGCLVRAAQSTKRALEAALKTMKTAKNERELEAAFDHVARIEGAGAGFATIVASGPHATVLHWTKNNGPMSKKGLVLLDVGVESNQIYTADISRTFPVSGKFSREQRALYDLVTAAQEAAFKAAKPGAPFQAPHDAATEVLIRGIHELGIFKEDPDQALRPERQTFKRFTLHNVSHMLGLDVHDNAPLPYRQETLEEGMVVTVEPGLYFQPDDLTVPPKYRGIGIRVEDDLLITKTGSRVLSRMIPRKADEIEAWIASLWKT